MKLCTGRSWVWSWWLLYIVFIIYGSLIPFQLKDEAPRRILRALIELFMVHSPGTHISGMDVLANFTLYIPLGFLSALVILKNKGGVFLAFISSIIFGILLSLSIEVCQTYFSDRTSSILDTLTNALGVTVGAFIAGIYFLFFSKTKQDARLHTTLLLEKPLLFVILIYGSLIFLGAFVPFDISIQPSDLRIALKQAEWLPFTSIPINYPNLISQALFYSVYAGLCYFSLKLYKRSWPIPGLLATLLTIALGLGVEFGQLFIVSRSTKISDVLIAALGGLVGATVGSILVKLLSSNDPLSDSESLKTHRYRFFYPKLLLVLGYCLIAAYLLLAPLQFELGWHEAIKKFTWRTLTPLYAYWIKMNFWAVYDLISTCLIFAPLGILGTYCFRPLPLTRTITLILALFLSIGIEFLQFFEPGRYPDITDVISAVGGTLLGIRAVEKLPVNVSADKNSSGTRSH